MDADKIMYDYKMAYLNCMNCPTIQNWREFQRIRDLLPKVPNLLEKDANLTDKNREYEISKIQQGATVTMRVLSKLPVLEAIQEPELREFIRLLCIAKEAKETSQDFMEILNNLAGPNSQNFKNILKNLFGNEPKF